jgi:hypothetical protein
MLKVFLGSTFRDLKGHRQAVRDAINRLDGCKCIAMEDFGSHSGQPKEVCREPAAGCDIFVGLVGRYYGFVPEGETVSITELEYETARSLCLPRLLFVADDSFTPVFIRESEAAYTRQEQLRARILAGETVDQFGNDAEKLAARVAAALTNEIARHRAGPEPSRPAALWPEKPEGFVERPAEYDALKAALLGHAGRPVGITTALNSALTNSGPADSLPA